MAAEMSTKALAGRRPKRERGGEMGGWSERAPLRWRACCRRKPVAAGEGQEKEAKEDEGEAEEEDGE